LGEAVQGAVERAATDARSSEGDAPGDEQRNSDRIAAPELPADGQKRGQQRSKGAKAGIVRNAIAMK
jgi:hypothetical protein